MVAVDDAAAAADVIAVLDRNGTNDARSVDDGDGGVKVTRQRRTRNTNTTTTPYRRKWCCHNNRLFRLRLVVVVERR